MSYQYIADHKSEIPLESMPPLSMDEFRRQTGLSPVTLWRFRKRGWLTTVVIAGRHYVTREAITSFNHRAACGEFSGTLANPSVARIKINKQ